MEHFKATQKMYKITNLYKYKLQKFTIYKNVQICTKQDAFNIKNGHFSCWDQRAFLAWNPK